MNLIVDIQTFGNRGVGISRSKGKVIFIPFSAPGDRAEIRIKTSHKCYDEGEIVNILKPSSMRREPPCPYFMRCGGCQLQHIHISSQREIKKELFKEILTYKGGVIPERIGEILFTPEEFEYRSRLDMHVGGGKRPFLGFKALGSSEIIAIERCLLALPPLQNAIEQIQLILQESRAFNIKKIEISSDFPEHGISLLLLCENGLSPYSIHSIKRMANQLSWLRGVYFAKGKGEKFEIIWERGDGFKGVIYCIPSPKGEKIYLESWPGVFRQVNPFVNNLLIKMAIDWINEGPTESILDLYSGMGNLTIPFSYLTKNITGVEVNPLSVENARINMKRLNLENIELIRASTKKALKNFVEEKRKFDLIILDPPRGGAIDILEGIILLNPERIIYISCDQATLARDLRYLQESGQYKVNRIYPFDMFPQTFHIESITLLKKID